MNTTLIRTLAIAILATSISAFAKTGDTKGNDAAAQCNVTNQDNSKQKANDSGNQNKSTNSQGEDQEEQEQIHLLMGIYG